MEVIQIEIETFAHARRLRRRRSIIQSSKRARALAQIPLPGRCDHLGLLVSRGRFPLEEEAGVGGRKRRFARVVVVVVATLVRDDDDAWALADVQHCDGRAELLVGDAELGEAHYL
jgi:hypothetical protein